MINFHELLFCNNSCISTGSVQLQKLNILLIKEEQNNEFSRSKVENKGKCTLPTTTAALKVTTYLIVYIFKIIFLKFGPIIILNFSEKPVQIIL
jgi:hypothetical protein